MKFYFPYKNHVMSQKPFEFVVYIINACSNKWNKASSEVYKELKYFGCLDFLTANYEVLHTLSADNVVNDVEEFLRVRGACR